MPLAMLARSAEHKMPLVRSGASCQRATCIRTLYYILTGMCDPIDARTPTCAHARFSPALLTLQSVRASQCTKQNEDWPALQLSTIVHDTLQPGCTMHYRLDPATLHGTACSADNATSDTRLDAHKCPLTRTHRAQFPGV